MCWRSLCILRGRKVRVRIGSIRFRRGMLPSIPDNMIIINRDKFRKDHQSNID